MIIIIYTQSIACCVCVCVCTHLQVWDFDKLQECLSEEHGLPSDWVNTTLTVCQPALTDSVIIPSCYLHSDRDDLFRS